MKVLFYAAALPFLAAALFAGQPIPVSVSPASQTFSNSATMTYTFVASDSDGAGDLLGIDALFGNSYECWLFYNRPTNQISVFSYHPSPIGAWTSATAGQPGPTLFGNACNVDPSSVTASASGNNLSVSVSITLGGLSGNNQPIYLSALNNAQVGSPYMKLASWTVLPGSDSNFFTFSVSPGEGFIAAGGSTQATVTVTDRPGFNGTINLSLGQFPNGSNLTGSFNPASITGNGSSTLTITSSAESPESMDPVDIFAVSSTDDTLQTRSTFLTMIDTTPPTLTMGFANSGSGGNFLVDVDDHATAETIQGYNVLFNTTLDGRNACWVWYDARTNYIWLANDDTTSWSGVVLNGPVTVSNSQCTVGSNGSSVTNPRTLGEALATDAVISFKPAFAGTKNVYARTANFAGFDTGYQLKGTYTVQ